MAETGLHVITVVDEDGNTMRCPFIIIGNIE
jgi:hypothetical protein